MRSASLAIPLVFGICAITVAARESTLRKSTLGEKVAAYCKKHLGEQVGNGQCASLAAVALRSVGAKTEIGADDLKSGDYKWGKLIFVLERDGKDLKRTGKIKDVRPGDIIQFRNAKWVTDNGKSYFYRNLPHHTAVVIAVEKNGKSVRIYHQNYDGKQFVFEDRISLTGLTEGWLRFYRPLADEEAQ